MDSPIIILASPRSGSSMVAGIFARHGVWTGPYIEGKTRNPKGHFESIPFKDEIIRHCGRITETGEVPEPIEGWENISKRILKENKYESGPWLVKHSALAYRIWEKMNPLYICVRRPLDAIIASNKAQGWNKNLPHLEKHEKIMNNLKCPQIRTDKFPDFSELECAFQFCGLEFKEKIAEEFYEPAFWHF